MLARSSPLPTGRGWAYEVKWEGFRVLVSTMDGLRVRSRRGWNMTGLLPELERLPEGLILDGELVASDQRGHPDFHRLSQRMLHGDTSIPVCLVVFDVLAVEGLSVMGNTYAERRGLLDELELDGPYWKTAPSFDDGPAVWHEVCTRRLEGVVAKRLRDPYRPGERGWVKRKNPDGPRFEQERGLASGRPRTRTAAKRSGPASPLIFHLRASF